MPSNRKIAKNTIIMYCRMVMIMFIALFTSRIVLDGLGVTNYGIYNLVGGIATFFSFINFAMLASTQRFLNYELSTGSKESLNKTFKTALTIHLIMAFFIVILAEPFGFYMIQYKLQIPSIQRFDALIVFQCSLACVFLQIIYVPYNAVIIARENIPVYAVATILQSILNLCAAYAIKFLNTHNIVTYGLFILGSQIIICIFYIIYCLKFYPETRGRLRKDNRIFKEMIVFTSWNIYGGLSWMMCTQGINILLGIFFMPVVNAARGISIQVQNAVTQIYTNLNTVISPQLIQSYAKRELEIFLNLLYKSSKYFVFLLYIVAVPIFIRTHDILTLWLKEVPDYTSIFVKILLGISVLDALGVPLKLSVDASGKVKWYHFIIGAIQISVIIFAYLVLSAGGNPQSALIVYLIISFIALFIRLKIIIRIIPELSIGNYFKEVILKVISVLVSFLCYGYFISEICSHNIIGLLSFVIISIIGGITIIYFEGLTQKEKLVINSYCINFIKSNLLKH